METSKSFIGQVNLIKVLPWDADINAFGFSYYQQTWTIQFQNFSGHQLWTNLPRQDGGGSSTSRHTSSGSIPKNFYWKKLNSLHSVLLKNSTWHFHFLMLLIFSSCLQTKTSISKTPWASPQCLGAVGQTLDWEHVSLLVQLPLSWSRYFSKILSDAW